MKYFIKELEKATTKDGKAYAKLSLTDINDVTHHKVGYWDNPHVLSVGQEIEGEVYTNEKGYINFKSNGGAYRGSGGGMGAKLMEKKAESIEKSQDRKEEGVKTSASFRDATLIALEFFKRNPSMSELQFNQKWIEVRRWLLDHYEIESSDVPF